MGIHDFDFDVVQYNPVVVDDILDDPEVGSGILVGVSALVVVGSDGIAAVGETGDGKEADDVVAEGFVFRTAACCRLVDLAKVDDSVVVAAVVGRHWLCPMKTDLTLETLASALAPLHPTPGYLFDTFDFLSQSSVRLHAHKSRCSCSHSPTCSFVRFRSPCWQLSRPLDLILGDEFVGPDWSDWALGAPQQEARCSCARAWVAPRKPHKRMRLRQYLP